MTKILSAISLMFAITFISGCGSNIQTVHAQATPTSLFSGRYIFKSNGFSRAADGTLTPFYEGGTITADGNGNYTLDSWMNILSPGSGTPEHATGTYTIDSTTMQGTASQTDPATSQQCGCSPTDTMSLTISADGSHAILVSKDVNFTWLAELTRD